MSFYLGFPLVQAFLSLILLIIILTAKSQDKARNQFAMYLFGILVWGVLIFFMRSSPDLDAAYFWEKLLLPIGFLLSVILYHFSVNFSGFRTKRWIIFTGYLVFTIFLLLSEFGLVVDSMQLKSYGYAPVGGPLFLIVALASSGFVLAAIINLWKYSKIALFKEERNRSLYILTGMIISMVGGALDVLPLLGLSLYPGLIFGNIIFCIITSVAILKYRLLGIHIILRKGTTYFLISAIVTTPYLILLLIFEYVLRTNVPSWTMFFLFLILAMVLQPVWRLIQSLVDKMFYTSRYDFLKDLEDFSQNNHRVTDINSLGKSLVALVGRALQTPHVYLFLPSSQGKFRFVSSSQEKATVQDFLSNNPILIWLRKHKIVLRREEMAFISKLQSLSAEEINDINTVQAELFVPVFNKEDDLVGIVTLGPKLNHQPYSDEDEQLILSVTNRLALELENSRLYSQEMTARKELQKQNDAKTEFLHSITHELKTPLTAIIASSEMLDEKLSVDGEDLEQRLTKNIHESSLAMNRRVSELLDFARVQIGSMQIKEQLLDVNLIVQGAASQLSPLFSSRKQHLGLEVQPVASVKADKDKLEQAIINLLSNANKYSPNNSEITIRTRQANNNVLVEVEDSAPIISEDERNKLFTPYYRGEDIKVRQRIPGLGLGLAITKKIIEMHGGKIWIDANPGKGNIFAFSLAISN